jgi:hypothetical protein
VSHAENRIDILPKEYTEELSLLQDNVPGFSGEIAKAIIKQVRGCENELSFTDCDGIRVVSIRASSRYVRATMQYLSHLFV